MTHYTLVYAGTGGLNLLSFISGFSDITPFILNLLQGTGSVAVLVITACSMQAIVSNIVVNMCYALFLPAEKSLASVDIRGIRLRDCNKCLSVTFLLFSLNFYLFAFLTPKVS